MQINIIESHIWIGLFNDDHCHDASFNIYYNGFHYYAYFNIDLYLKKLIFAAKWIITRKKKYDSINCQKNAAFDLC